MKFFLGMKSRIEITMQHLVQRSIIEVMNSIKKYALYFKLIS